MESLEEREKIIWKMREKVKDAKESVSMHINLELYIFIHTSPSPFLFSAPSGSPSLTSNRHKNQSFKKEENTDIGC